MPSGTNIRAVIRTFTYLVEWCGGRGRGEGERVEGGGREDSVPRRTNLRYQLLLLDLGEVKVHGDLPIVSPALLTVHLLNIAIAISSSRLS